LEQDNFFLHLQNEIYNFYYFIYIYFSIFLSFLARTSWFPYSVDIPMHAYIDRIANYLWKIERGTDHTNFLLRALLRHVLVRI